MYLVTTISLTNTCVCTFVNEICILPKIIVETETETETETEIEIEIETETETETETVIYVCTCVNSE